MVPETDPPHTIEEADLPALLGKLLARSEDGGATVITRGGKPIAAIVSMDDYEAAEDEIDRRMDAWEPPADDGVRYSLEDLIAEHRQAHP